MTIRMGEGQKFDLSASGGSTSLYLERPPALLRCIRSEAPMYQVGAVFGGYTQLGWLQNLLACQFMSCIPHVQLRRRRL